MKKTFLTILLTGIVSFCVSAQAPVRVGGFFGYASDIRQGALGGIAEFMLNDKMAISPSLLFYFTEVRPTTKHSWYELNGNFKYYFLNEDVVHLYGLVGLNFTHFKSRRRSDNEVTFTNGELGLNMGFGLNFNVSKKVIPFSEMKYIVSDYDHAALFLGVKVNVN